MNMGRHVSSKFSFLMSFLLLFQLLFPVVTVFAETINSSILPPSNLDFQLQTPDDVKLTWSSVYGATGYNVYEIDDGQLVLLGKSTSTSYTINNLPEGTYRYVVSTLSAEGESGPCAPLTVDIVYPDMEAPASLTYTIQNGNDIVLNWTSAQYTETYNIYQIEENDQKTLVSSVTGRTYRITNAAAGTYTYAVSSDNSKYGESTLSTPAQVTVVHPQLTKPGNLTYTVSNGNDVTLRWGAVTYATGYKVYQIVNDEKVLKSTVTGTTVTYSNMPVGSYVYEVHSYSDRFGESQEGSQVSLTVGEIILTAPSNFAYNIKNGNDIVLTWGTVANATSYKVYQIVNDEKVLKSTVTGTTVTYTKMTAGDYIYQVHAYSDRFGESQEGSQVSFTVGDVTMVPPSNFAYNIKNGNDIVLTWGTAANATSYKVYQIINDQKVLKSSVSSTTATYSNMPAGDYNYVIHSYATNFGESQEGSTLSFSLVHPTMQPPEHLVHTIKTATDFTLNWDASAYAMSYKVYQIVNGQKVLKSTVSGTTVAYTNMQPGEYTFEVHSYSNRFGESLEGSKLTMTLNGQMMEAPTNLTYTIANGNDITLKWTAAPYATSYKVYQVIDGQKELKSTVSTTTTKYTNMPNGDYVYVVHSASTILGESPSGAEVTFTLVHPTMVAPGNLAYKIQNGNDVVLTWAAVPYVNSYKVYELVDGQKVLKTSVSSTAATLSDVSAGEHTYVVHSVSTRFGESQVGSQVSLTVAEHMMSAPGNLTQSIANGNDLTLRWSAVTYATSYKVYQIIDEQKVLKSTVNGTYATYANIPAGDYKFEVHSFSNDFGESPEGSQISFTLVFPTMQAPSNLTQSITSGNDIILKWNTVTYATSYKVYQIIDEQKILKSTVNSTVAAFTNMPAGDYSYEVHSYSDRFGESPTASKVSFTLVWPVVQPSVLNGTVFNANNITLSWQAVNWANEYRIYEIKGNTRQLIYKGTALSYKIYNLSEETHSYEMTAYNTRFGESALSNRITETIVYPIMQPPVATVNLLSTTSARISWNFITYSNGYNVYEIIDGKPVILTKNLNNLSYTVSDLSYADHQYYVTSFSNSFGESDPSNIVIAKLIVDTEPPVTTANAPTDWTNQSPIAVTLSATDNETGVAKTYYSLNDSEFVEGTSFTVNEEGVHTISFYSVDKVGNTEATQTIYVKIDKTAPITKASEGPAWSNQPATVDLTATDTQSGVGKILYSINGSDYVEGTTLTVDKEGVNQVSFYSVDKVGNIEKEQTIEVKIDGTAPVTTSNAPVTWSKEDVTVNLTAKDAQSGVANTFYSIDGSEMEGTSFTIREEGIHKITFYSVDLAGNSEPANTVEVKIDKTAPVITMNLNDQYKLGDTLELMYVAKDNLSGVANEKMTIFGPNETTGEVLENGDTIELDEPGVYNITVTVTDAVGLSTTIQKQLMVYIPATIEVTPKVIKGNNGVFTVRVNLPAGYSTQGFDLNTATLNGVKALTSNNGYYNQAKLGQFKFERSDFSWTPSEVKVEFRCYVDGYLVVGETTVKVQK